MNKLCTEKDIILIGNLLLNTNRPLKERFRALFTLKNIGGSLAIKNIVNCFKDSSALLKHELAYCLGQINDGNATSYLINVLEDVSHEPIVRHEAGEALGAIGDPGVENVLKIYAEDDIQVVAETCQLALLRLNWLKGGGKNGPSSEYFFSIDPAPPTDELDITKLKQMLMDINLNLYERYRAMFSLRNLNTAESAKALVIGFKEENSALFRHEIAYVLGQMGFEEVVDDLAAVVEDKSESDMVRHEAAEALGSIASEKAVSILQKFVDDEARIVRESCEVALDMCEYENSKEFQYANALTQIKTFLYIF